MNNKLRFFSELSSIIEYASTFDSKLNRKLAHEFNIFDFLRDDEIGLSQIIAHLLNPLASHGQGTFFLQHFLKFVKNDKHWNHLDSHTINIETEHSTFENRRIDVYIEILGENPFILAIENKPYAGDQENQVLHYLEYLEKKSIEFLLIYLSSDGDGPSEYSFPKEKRNQLKENFAIMAYAESSEKLDDFQDAEEKQLDARHRDEYQFVNSFAAWLKTCREKCEVDRLRWFLGDAENFCNKTFGSSKSTDDLEVQVVKSFLYKNPSFIDTAYEVYEAWPSFVNEVSKIFLNHIVAETNKRLKKGYPDRDDIEVGCMGDLLNEKYIYMYLFSDKWIPYMSDENEWPTYGRYYIILCNDRRYKPDQWYVGVHTPNELKILNDSEKVRFNQIKEELTNRDSELKVWRDQYFYKYVDSEKQDWEPNLGMLFDESRRGQREDSNFTEYYVQFFWEFAEKAISVLDKVEQRP